MIDIFWIWVQEISDLGITLLVFLFIFGLLIVLHEFGHFWAARAAGVRVLEFGFGMPPKIWGKKTSRSVLDSSGKEKKEEMEWTINAIPFGGFVRMHGEADHSSDPDAFGQRPLLWRMLVICGGVMMNFLIGWVLFTSLFIYGVDPNPQTRDQFEAYIEQGYYEVNGVFISGFANNSSAEAAGLEVGDRIIALDDQEIMLPQDIVDIPKEAHQALEIQIERDNISQTITVIPNENGLLGVYPTADIVLLKKEQYSIIESVQKAFTQCISVMKGSLTLLGDLMVRLTSSFELPEEIGGPVAIAYTTDKLLEIGDATKLISFTAMISLSLAVINIMPFPGLDGGRFVFLLLEAFLVIKAWILRIYISSTARNSY